MIKDVQLHNSHNDKLPYAIVNSALVAMFYISKPIKINTIIEYLQIAAAVSVHSSSNIYTIAR